MLYLLTGGNLGNRAEYLQFAENQINENIGQVFRKSNIYETSAWGVTDQPAYLNQVLEVKTEFSAYQILEKIHQIEAKAGRTRYQKWTARTLDIDVLFIDNQVIHESDLMIPHPHLQNRNFVLAPLCELIPDFEHPILKESIQTLTQNCPDELKVTIWK